MAGCLPGSFGHRWKSGLTRQGNVDNDVCFPLPPKRGQRCKDRAVIEDSGYIYLRAPLFYYCGSALLRPWARLVQKMREEKETLSSNLHRCGNHLRHVLGSW